MSQAWPMLLDHGEVELAHGPARTSSSFRVEGGVGLRRVRLVLEGPVVVGVYEAADAFDALAAARQEWEAAGWRFGVDGARANAWPSGMARDMANGLKVYLFTGATPTDLASTFHPCDTDDVVTFDVQRDAFRGLMT